MSRNQEQETRRFLVVSQRTLNALATRRRFLAGTVGLGAGAAFGRQAFATPSRNAAYQRQAAQEELSIIIGTLGEANTINPFLSSDSEADWRCKMLYDEFVRANPTTYAAEPGIASEWTVDNLTFTFTIRPEAKFSDGSQLTAEDVAFTINGILAQATG
jgi:peptide/nickel transport system substrate-binding protein